MLYGISVSFLKMWFGDEQAYKQFGHVMRRTDSGKDLDAGKDWREEEEGTTEDEMLQSKGVQRVRHDWTAELTDWLTKEQTENAGFKNEMLGKREKKNRVIEGLQAAMFVKPLLRITL